MPKPTHQLNKKTERQSVSVPWRCTVGFLCMLLTTVVVLYSLSSDLCFFLHGGGLHRTATATGEKRDVHVSTDNKPTLKQTSAHAAVMGMAFNYQVPVFKSFVGSLRRTGYQGQIILAVSDEPGADVEAYLNSHNVTMKKMNFVECQFESEELKQKAKDAGGDDEVKSCHAAHPDLKIRWGRFAVLRDWLEECQECTGSVLVTDVRDTFFQRDPFGPEAPAVDGLHVFEEHRNQRTSHWLVQSPVERCKKKKQFDYAMLCSGTTIGTREAMLRYLGDMATEMRAWMKDKDCCCTGMVGDDQAVHNWLFYSGGLPYATAQPNRVGLVNTVGFQGAIINNARGKLNKQLDACPEKPDGYYNSKEEEDKGNWLGAEYDQTDEQGFFTDFNGERSFIVHQFDRYGYPVDRWLWNHGPLKGL